MTDQRSKKPTLRTLPEAPKAKLDGPRVATKAPLKAPDVSLSTSPETPSSRKTPTPPPVRDSLEDMQTHVFDSGNFKRPPAEGSINDTIVDAAPAGPPIDPDPLQKPVAIEDSGSFRREASTPIKVISMKTPHADTDRDTPPRAIPQVHLRALSEVNPGSNPQVNLGNFAPPLNLREVRARRARDFVIWGCLAVMIASVIAIAMWFLAR